ncbi:hypothetical protein Tco_0545708 [Tanacetum coccineum]
MEYVKKSNDKRALHKREYDSRVNERQMQTTEEKVDTSKALDASLVDTKSSGTESVEQDTSSRSGNDAHADDADIKPIYDEEPMAEVQLIADHNVFATGQQYTEQPEFNNEGEVDQNPEQCHDTCPLPVKSKEAKVKHDIDVIETINIELEHKMAKLLKENETLKRHYKELFDSIKTTRAKTIEHTTSLIAQNAEFKAQLQEKGFAIAALKNELRKLTGNSVNTKFAKSSILGKPVLQPHRNQSVVRQPTAFKSERPRISKPRFASQVDVNNDLPKPVTTHYLPKERESAFENLNIWFHLAHLGEKQRSSCLRWKPMSKIFKTVGLRRKNIDLSAGTPFNLKKDRIKTWTKDVISERPRLHGIASLKEISAKPSSQGFQSLLNKTIRRSNNM